MSRMGGGFLAEANVQEARISVVVTRANGKVEDHGTVSYWHKNPLRRWAWSANRAARAGFQNLMGRFR